MDRPNYAIHRMPRVAIDPFAAIQNQLKTRVHSINPDQFEFKKKWHKERHLLMVVVPPATAAFVPW